MFKKSGKSENSLFGHMRIAMKTKARTFKLCVNSTYLL